MLRLAHLTLLAAATALAILPGAAQAQPAGQGADVGLDGHRHDTVTIRCITHSNSTCNFIILRAKGGVIPVKVKAGQQATQDDVEVGKDYFIVTLNTPPPTSLSVCRAMAADYPTCHWGLLRLNTDEAKH